MKLLFTLTGVLLFMASGIAQDEKAKKILNDLSNKTKTFKTIEATFNSRLVNKSSGIDEKQNGKVIIKGEKFKVDMDDQDIISNGLKVWTYIKSDKQVYVSDYDPNDDEMINPKEIFTIWEKGYKYKHAGKKTHKGKSVDVIKLFPKNAKTSKFHTIILKVDTQNNGLVHILIKGKDGTNMEYDILKMTPNKSFPDAEFIFNRGKHPGVEIIEN